MRKTTFYICKNKGADQLLSNCKAYQHLCAFVFATCIVQFLFFLNLKCSASSHLLLLYSSVCVGPVQKPQCWLSHDMAHLRNIMRKLPFLQKPKMQIRFAVTSQLISAFVFALKKLIQNFNLLVSSVTAQALIVDHF